MVYISCNAIIAKNIPKYFLNIFTSVWTDKFAPIIAPSIPNIEIIVANFKSIFLFLMFTIIATIDVGMKNIKNIFYSLFDICIVQNDINLKSSYSKSAIL